MKILILIIASDTNTAFFVAPENDGIYPELQKIWRTYMNIDREHVEVYFLKSNPDLTSPFKIKGDTIWSKGEETWIPGVLNKTIVSLEAMMPRIHEFDYVIRTNLSSFYIFSRLFKFLQTVPKEKCYCGMEVPYQGGAFLSGCGFIISPDLVNILVQHKDELYNQNELDDILIGRVFRKYQIPFIGSRRTDFLNIAMWNASKGQIPEDAFHFRTKNPPGFRLTDELYIQRELLKMFYGIHLDPTPL